MELQMFANPKVTSVQSNAQPTGGTTAQQPVKPVGQMTPTDIKALIDELTPTAEKFRASSSPLEATLNQQTLKAGQDAQIRIASVGLGYRIIRHHKMSITLDNTAGTAQVVDVSSWFPFNIINKTQVQINGGATVYSAGGPSSLLVAARDRRSSLRLSGTGPKLSDAIVTVTFDANATPTTGKALSGVASLSIAASSNTVITVDMYEVIKLALDRDSLIGALPLQNSSVFAQLGTSLVANILGTDETSPLYVSGGVPGTLSVTSFSDVVNSTYKFWSVPSNPGLYSEMVRNSYQVQEQPSLAMAGTGSEAYRYQIPTNQFVLAMHLLGYDSTGTYQDYAGLTRFLLTYGADSVIPVRRFMGRANFENLLDYGSDLKSIPGYFMWDGSNTSDDLTRSGDAGWLDTYSASNPQIVGDVDAGFSTPGKMLVCRESIVSGQVVQIGG